MDEYDFTQACLVANELQNAAMDAISKIKEAEKARSSLCFWIRKSGFDGAEECANAIEDLELRDILNLRATRIADKFLTEVTVEWR